MIEAFKNFNEETLKNYFNNFLKSLETILRLGNLI